MFINEQKHRQMLSPKEKYQQREDKLRHSENIFVTQVLPGKLLIFKMYKEFNSVVSKWIALVKTG